jgi:tryptophan-rich sensory protein
LRKFHPIHRKWLALKAGIVCAQFLQYKESDFAKQFKFITMLYLIAVILIIGWILGFFVFSAGKLIHILLVVAIIAIILRLIRGDRVV